MTALEIGNVCQESDTALLADGRYVVLRNGQRRRANESNGTESKQFNPDRDPGPERELQLMPRDRASGCRPKASVSKSSALSASAQASMLVLLHR